MKIKTSIAAGLTVLGVGAAFLLAGRSAQARETTYGPWRSVKIGGGGYIQNVVLCPSNPRRLYTYVDVGGLSRSDDGGQSWRMLHGALPARAGNYEIRGLLVDPRDDKKVMIAAGSQWNAPEGIYVSADAGTSWRKTLSAQFAGNGPERWTGFILARHPRNPDVVVAAGEGDGLFHSADNGRTWHELGGASLKGLHATDVRFDRADPNRLWLCARPFNGWMGGSVRELKGGFFRSGDGGATWTKLLDDGPSEILQDPRDAGVLYGLLGNRPALSRDAGASWAALEDGLPPRDAESAYTSEGGFQALAAGPGFVLTASTKGTFYRLQSGETRWQKIERQGLEEIYEGEQWFHHQGGGFGSALGSITVDPRDANHWFFTDWFAIYQTRDAGRNWKLTIDGIEVTVLHALAQDPSNPAVVHLGMADNGYFYSENGGERFYNVDRRKGISNNVKSIAVAPSQPNRLYATGPRTWEWEANQVFASLDRGRTWTRSPMNGLPDMTKHHCNTIAVDAKNPAVVYLAVSQDVKPNAGGVYQSEDGGQSWTWMSAGLPQDAPFFTHDIWGIGREIAVSPDGALLCISRDRSEIYRYDPARKTWLQSGGAGGKPWSVVADVSKPGRFFAGTESGVWRTEDGGATWRKTFAQGVHHVAVDAARPRRVAAGTADGVVLSEDGGTTWRALDKRLPYRIYNLVAFAGERLIIGTGGNGAFWIPLSPRGSARVRARPDALK